MDAEVWKAIAMTLGTIVIGEGAVLWRMANAIQQRPTFVQVEELLVKYERGSDYARESGTIKAELIRLAKDIESSLRHIDQVKNIVEELHLMAIADLKARSIIAQNLSNKEHRES